MYNLSMELVLYSATQSSHCRILARYARMFAATCDFLSSYMEKKKKKKLKCNASS